IRAVSKAICTSGEPVSVGSRRYWSMISVLRSFVIAISVLTTSAVDISCLICRDCHNHVLFTQSNGAWRDCKRKNRKPQAQSVTRRQLAARCVPTADCAGPLFRRGGRRRHEVSPCGRTSLPLAPRRLGNLHLRVKVSTVVYSQ